MPGASSVSPSSSLDQLVALCAAGGLGDLGADPHRRVQRSHRILEDGCDVAAAARPALLFGCAQHVLATEQDAAAHQRQRLARQQAERREAENALARARLADEPDYLTRGDRQRRAAQCVDVPARGGKGHVQVGGLERVRGCRDAHAATPTPPALPSAPHALVGMPQSPGRTSPRWTSITSSAALPCSSNPNTPLKRQCPRDESPGLLSLRVSAAMCSAGLPSRTRPALFGGGTLGRGSRYETRCARLYDRRYKPAWTACTGTRRRRPSCLAAASGRDGILPSPGSAVG
jgi:hypothetical protein